MPNANTNKSVIKKSLCSLIFVVLALSGCSKGPSTSDAKKAFAKEFVKEKNQFVLGLPVDATEDQVLEKLKELKVIGCKEDSTGSAYNCSLTGPNGAIEAKFIKGSDGWDIMNK